MPASVAVAVAGAAASSAAVSAGWFAAGSFAAAAFGAGAAALAGAVIGPIFADKPKQQQPAAAAFKDSLLTVRQPVSPWQVIYGRTRVGGTLTFAESSNSGQYLHLVITLAGHRCEEIGEIWFNDEVVPLDGSGFATGRYAGFVIVQKSLGDEGDLVQPFPTLVSANTSWTASWCQSRRAKLYVRLQRNPDLFPTGVPNITAVVKGKRVYDPRSGLTAWTDNAALCIADYLTTEASVGVGAVYADEIDEDELIADANLCDETVTLAAGGTEARYTLNGAFTVNATPRQVLGRLLTANAGSARYIGGRWRVQSATYRTPTITFTEADLRGPIHIMPRLSRRDLANGVKGTYIAEANYWQPAGFPAVTSSTYLAEDQNERIWRELDLPYTKTASAAQRIAKIELLRTRQQITIEWPGQFVCYQAQPGDVVQITFAKYGWSAKAFEVVNTTLTAEEGDEEGAVRLGTDLVLRETASTVFDWATSEEEQVDPAPDTNLPSLGVTEPLNVAVSSGTDDLLIAGDGTVVSRMRVRWDASDNAFVTTGGRVLVQYKPDGADTWLDAPPVDGAATETFISPVDDGAAYRVRVRFQNGLLVRSNWAPNDSGLLHTVVGKTAPASDIQSFTIEGSRLNWTRVTDADLAGYRLRYQPGVNRSWGNAVWLHGAGDAQDVVTSPPFEMLRRPAGQVTLMAKAVDTSGNESENVAYIVTDLGDALVANVVETFDLKAAGFAGTITNGSVSGGNLVADTLSSPLMWSAEAADWWSWDSGALMWASSMYKAMTYVDSVTVSEALAGSRLTLEATVAGDPWSIEYRENSQALWWDADGSTLMWGSDSSALMWDSPAWQPWPGSIEVQNTIVDFRITTGQSITQGVISALTVTVDAPDIEEFLNDVVISAAGTRLALTEDFSVIRNVQLTVQNDGGTAISARTEDKSATLGPLVKCYDAAGAATTGLVDARVQGY